MRFRGKELQYIKEVLDTNFSASNPSNMCKRFEESFAKKLNVKYAISYNSGTSTMHGCLAACGVGPGDEVIVPAITVVSTANAVIYQNAIPIFADVKSDTFNIDPDDIKRKITSRTKAIIPVSLYGLSPDMDAIMEIAKDNNLTVIEDDAESPFATYKGKYLGTIGDMSSFSFENSKHIVTGDGGMITTNNKELAIKCRAFATQGYKVSREQSSNVRDSKDIFQDPDYRRHDTFGFSYKMPEVICAIGLAQIEQYKHWIDLRCKIAEMYHEVIKDCNWFTPQYVHDDYKNVYWTYAVKYDPKKNGHVSWKDFRKKYMEFGGDGIYAGWIPVYLEDVYQKGKFYGKGCPFNCHHYTGNVIYKKGLCPTAEKIQPQLMQFVTNYLSIEEAIPKIDALKKTIDYFSY